MPDDIYDAAFDAGFSCRVPLRQMIRCRRRDDAFHTTAMLFTPCCLRRRFDIDAAILISLFDVFAAAAD